MSAAPLRTPSNGSKGRVCPEEWQASICGAGGDLAAVNYILMS